MGIFDGGGVKRQLRSVIEWKDPAPDLLIWRWDGSGDELKNASKLLVNPGQAAIFVYQGKVQAVQREPGLTTLATANVPFWTTFTKILQAFESENKANVYFTRTTEFLDQKWGTKGPIKYDDPKYKFPVGLRAFGNFSFRLAEPERFFTSVTSVRHAYAIEEARTALVDRMLTPLTDLLAESGFSYAQIDRNRVELSEALKGGLAKVLSELGFELTDFRIENTDFDDETKARIGTIADQMAKAQAINALSGVEAGAMRSYAVVEQLGALRDAAKNEGGVAGLGVGVGAGLGLGQSMVGAFGAGGVPAAAPPAAPAPAAAPASAACRACQKPITPGAKFCPECGAPQALLCPGCKKELPPGTKFCPECGTKIQG
jgi:membrane protease subunit (stomatin/prohibitin family)